MSEAACADFFAGEPDYYLEATDQWVHKDDALKVIRRQYAENLRKVAMLAIPGTNLRRNLENYTVTARTAAYAKILDHHANLWLRKISEMKKLAEEEVDDIEAIIKKYEHKYPRQANLEDLRRMESRADTRFEKVEEYRQTALKLIKDLKTVLEAGRGARA